MDIREIETEIFGETANPFDRFCDTANASSACCDIEPEYEADGWRAMTHYGAELGLDTIRRA